MKPATLSTLKGAHFHAFEVDSVFFLVAFVIHPSTGWVSELVSAPTIPDIDGGQTSKTRFFYFTSKLVTPPQPGSIVIPMAQTATVTLRIADPESEVVYVQDGNAIYEVPIEKV